MPYHADAWIQVLSGAGVHVERQDIYNIEGSNHSGVIRLMFEKAGRIPDSAEVEELARKKREVFSQISGLKVFDGITECLRNLKGRYLLGVVSGSDRSTVLNILDRFFPMVFDSVISGEDVNCGKPSPEPYLKMVELLGVQKDECIVFENAPLGVESAKRANLFCVAVPTYVEPDVLEMADVVLENHKALTEYLGRLPG